MSRTNTYSNHGNFFFHLTEGILYMSSGAFLAGQTVIPALLIRLGASNTVLGLLPVVIFLGFFLPQIVAANHTMKHPFRKPWVIRGGFIQRMHILLLAIVVLALGGSYPVAAMIGVLVVLLMNQAAAGSVSPAWIDFVAKTVDPNVRGKLMGFRSAGGALLGFGNGFVLAWLLASFAFPYSYGFGLLIAFLFQGSSLIAQNRVVEIERSAVKSPVPFRQLLPRIIGILKHDHSFRRFLVAAGLLTVGGMPLGFFTAAAFTRYNVQDSLVGIFTSLTLAGQIISGVFVGWLADKHGNRLALLMTGAAFAAASTLALVAPSLAWYMPVFVLVGINVGAEMLSRYNYAIDCAAEDDRPMYVGLMNACISPLYLLSILAGWFIDRFGYDPVFVVSLVFSAAGLIILWKSKDPRAAKLALSSK